MSTTNQDTSRPVQAPTSSALVASDITAWSAISRVVRQYLPPHKWRLLFAFSANLVVAATTSLVPAMIQIATAFLIWIETNKTGRKSSADTALIDIPGIDTSPSNLPFGLEFSNADSGDIPVIYFICIGIVVVMGLKALATYVSGVQLNYAGQKVVEKIQTQLFTRLMHADLSWIQQTHSGRFISAFMSDAVRIRGTMTETVVNLTRHLFTVIGLWIYLYYLDPKMALLMSLIIPFAAINVRKLGKRNRKATTKTLVETGGLSALILESLSGLRVVKAYGQENNEIKRASGVIATLVGHQMKAVKAKAAASPTTEFLTGIGVAAVIFYAQYQVQNGDLTVDAFIGFMAAVMLAYQPLKAVANQFTMLQDGVAALSRLFPMLDQEPLIVDKPGVKDLVISKAAMHFQNVSLRYPDGTLAVENIDLRIEHGQSVALVGPSGSGKSTLLNMVPRFYDATEGGLLIDGQDVRSVSLGSLRSASSLVTQDPFLFDDTVRANIAYGSPDASQEEIEAAAQKAAAHDFIGRLSQGYDTRVGEAGGKLSGGQRQRIAIARALLKNAPILLLDEATSALDTASELQVQKALDALMEGRTTLVIAHRLSTIMHADKIYVIDAGHVFEQGTHQELIALDGLYAELYRTQFDRAEETPDLTVGK